MSTSSAVLTSCTARAARRRVPWLLCLALGLGGAACERTSAVRAGPPAGAPLTIGLTSGSIDVRPLVRTLTNAPLVSTGPDGRAAPGLLQRWTVSDDGRTWEFTLRAGVVDHDGNRVTARDIVELVDDQIAYEALAGLLDVDRLEVVDDQRFRIHLRAPSSLLLEALTLTRAVPAGPFRPDRSPVEADSSPTLIGQPGPDGTAPTVTHVIFRRYDSPRSAWAALLRDEIDLLHQVSGDARPFLEREPGIEVRPFLRPFVLTLGLNVAHPALRSTLVRVALNHAVDRREILEGDLGGHGEIATGPVSLRHWAADRSVTPYAYDPALASRLLDEAGLPMRPGGARGPSRLELTCLVPDDSPTLERVALRLQRSLHAVGVHLRPLPVPPGEFETRVQAGNFDAYLMTVLSGHGPSALYHMWGPYPGRWVNHGYRAAEPALEELRRAATDEAFARALQRVQRVLIDDPPAVFLVWDEVARAVGRRFVVPPGTGRDILSGLAQWRPREPEGPT